MFEGIRQALSLMKMTAEINVNALAKSILDSVCQLVCLSIGPSLKKMTTPSRKLRHTAEASLTVFPSEGEGGYKNSLFQCFVMFCNVL